MANGNFVHIPFNPANDPLTGLSKSLSAGAAGFSQGFVDQRELADQRNDIVAMKQWVDGGMTGRPPGMITPFGQSMAGDAVMDQLGRELTDPGGETLRLRRQQMTREGRIAEQDQRIKKRDARANRKLTRARARATSFQGQRDEDLLKFWQGIRNAAAGDFFNETLEGGADEPDDPEMFEFASKRLLEVKDRMQKAGGRASLGVDTPIGPLPRPTTQAGYDALAPLTRYQNTDGTVRIKGGKRRGSR